MRVKRIPFAATCIVVGALASVSGQSGAQSGEWRSYGGDIGHTRYSPLDQINAANFGKLEVAWRFKTDSLGPRPEFQYESTPLMVKGKLYSTGGSRRAVVALDAATGELLWIHSENEVARGAAAPTRQGPTPRAGATRRGMSAASTCAPASVSGSSTRFRSRASSATTPGKRIRGRTPATPACGGRSRWTKNWDWRTCPWSCRPA